MVYWKTKRKGGSDRFSAIYIHLFICLIALASTPIERSTEMNFILADALHGLMGGVLIGCAAALLLLGNGLLTR